MKLVNILLNQYFQKYYSQLRKEIVLENDPKLKLAARVMLTKIKL